jgi:hypothetical protein
MKVTVTCDRCKKIVEGLMEEERTSGFYNVGSSESPWSKYANPGEKVICDGWMWDDPGYILDYRKRDV